MEEMKTNTQDGMSQNDSTKKGKSSAGTFWLIGISVAVIVAVFLYPFFSKNKTYQFEQITFTSPITLKEDASQKEKIAGVPGAENAVMYSDESKNLNVYIASIDTESALPVSKDAIKSLKEEMGNPQFDQEFKNFESQLIQSSGGIVTSVTLTDNCIYGTGSYTDRNSYLTGYFIYDFESGKTYYIVITDNTVDQQNLMTVNDIYKSVMYKGKSLYKDNM